MLNYECPQERENKMIKVLHVDLICKEHNFRDPQDFLDKRGTSVMTAMASQMNASGKYENSVISLTRKKKGYFTDYNGMEFRFFEGKPSFLPNNKSVNFKLYNKELEKFTLDFKPDILHLNQSAGKNFYRYISFLLQNNFKYIIHFRGGNLNSFPKVRRRAFERSAAIILNNQDQKSKLIKVLPQIDHLLKVVPLGIDTEYFTPDANPINDEMIFCYTGRIYAHKGIEQALAFLSSVKMMGVQFKFIVAGQFETKEYEEHIMSKIKSLELQKYIIFPGYLVGDALRSVYRKSRYLLFLSEHESFGKSVVEAMACGAIPIVKSNSSGPEAIIDNGKYGYILPGDESYWNDFIKKITEQDDGLRQSVIARAGTYSNIAFIDRMKKVYNEIAASN